MGAGAPAAMSLVRCQPSASWSSAPTTACTSCPARPGPVLSAASGRRGLVDLLWAGEAA